MAGITSLIPLLEWNQHFNIHEHPCAAQILMLSSRHILGILHMHAKEQALGCNSTSINYIMHLVQLRFNFSGLVFPKLLSIGSRETKHLNEPKVHSMWNTTNEEKHWHNLLAKASYSEPFILHVSVFILFVEVVPPNLHTATRMGDV